MPRLTLCTNCGAHVKVGTTLCPCCGAAAWQCPPTRTSAALLLGLALAGCDALAPQSKYGIGETDVAMDMDGDGYSENEDCDDADENIHPDATETPGDGVDSNCNNDDDT